MVEDIENYEKVVNDLYLFYRFFVCDKFSENLHAPHIKSLSKELMKMTNGEYKRLCVAMPPRHKLADSTPVLTTGGWKTHGELEIGDYVFGEDGKPTKIIGVSEKSPCNKLITFSNGAKILAHSDHLWTVHKRGNKTIKTIPTSEIEKKWFHIEPNGKKRHIYHLPLIEPLKFDKKELPIDAYWLGYWLGNGSATKPCITHSKEDNQFIDNVPYEVSKQHIHKDTGVYTTYFSNQGILTELRELNLYDNKHIPQIYKESSFEDRIKLISGLIDSDGDVDKNGRVRFINTNKQLIDDFYEVCIGLGLYPYKLKPIKPEQINEYKKNSESLQIDAKKTCYQIGFQPRYSLPTTVPRKKIVEKGVRRKLAITNIETVEEEMGNCIEIENPDGIYLVGKELIPTHNSKSSLITISYPMWRIFQNPNMHILIVNNSSSLSEKFGIELREYIREYGKLFNVYLSDVKKSQSYLMFADKDGKLYNGSIRLVGKGGAITGTSADLLIIDDPIKGTADDLTLSAFEKLYDWFKTIILQRLEPNSELVILHTRWGESDLIGQLKEHQPDDYHFLEYSAILEDGTPLWKERYTTELLEHRREEMGNRMFEALYQQTPLDETSEFFDLTNLNYGKPQGDVIASVRAWDIASSDSDLGDERDYSVGSKMDLYPNGNVCITNIKRGQYGSNLKNILLETAISDGMDYHILIETGIAGAGALLQAEYEQVLKPYIVERALPVRSKEDRATPFRNAILDGHIYFDIPKDQLEECNKEFKSFPRGKHDDIIDSLSHGFNHLCRQDVGNKPDLMFIDL